MALKDLFRNGFINTFTVKITNNRYSFNFKYSGTEDLKVYLHNKVLEGSVDYSIVNGTKGTDNFYSGGTITLLNTNNTSSLTYTLSEEKPLYVGRFYNYDNIKELNNNEDLIQNVALKFNDMERALNDMRNLPNVITEFLSLYADANTANNFLSLDEDGNISDTAINSISNQVVSRMRLGFPAGATIPLTAPGMWYSTTDNNFHVFDGVTDRTLESYAQRLTINIIDALNSTSATAALSAKQGSILKGLVDNKADSTGNNSIAFNVAVATSDNNAVNKGQLDAGLALKPNSTSVTNEINARITNEFTARITSDATLASTDVDKTANTPSIKAYIDNSSEFTGYTGTVLFERTLSTAFSTSTFQRITLSEAYTNFSFIVFQTLSGKCFAHTADIGSSAINMTGTESIKSSTTTKDILVKSNILLRIIGTNGT
jgi:hypothetical protein